MGIFDFNSPFGLGLQMGSKALFGERPPQPGIPNLEQMLQDQPNFVPLFERSQEGVVRGQFAGLQDLESPVLQRIQQAREQVMGAQAGRTAEAQAQLARTGGLTSGARERVATAGANQGQLAEQDVQRQGLLAQLEAGQQQRAADEREIGALGHARALDAEGRQALNQFQQDRFDSLLKARAAQHEAQAISSQGKRGGVFGK